MLFPVIPFIAFAFLSQAAASALKCSNLKAPDIPGIEILSIEGTYIKNYTVPIPAGNVPPIPNPEQFSGLEFCDVTIYLSHPGVNDRVKVSVWLPPTAKWNGRFQATGGAGFATGVFDAMTTIAVEGGFSTASTDGGHPVDSGSAAWALYENRTINLPLFQNWVTRSLKDMAVIGQMITKSYYGKPAHHSYWNGCSTGGRQGYMFAQKYPEIFDGILANAPAMQFSRFVVAEMWPQVVMKQSGMFLSPCIAQKFLQASIEACDEIDGVKDGVVMDSLACKFDPTSIVGQEASCGGQTEIITAAMAEIIKKIGEGPRNSGGDRLWYGLPPNTPYGVLAGTKPANGALTGAPFPIAENFVKYLVYRDPNFNWETMTYDDFAWAFAQSTTRYGALADADNPDLSRFRDAGGKLLTYHGLTDDFIPVGGTIQYRQRVEEEMGGLEAVDEFYRLFLAPGVGHCGIPTSPGPVPDDDMSRLVAWVEKGEAPASIHASTKDAQGDLVERNICKYPYAQEYTGKDPKTSSGWKCSDNIMDGLKTEDANLDSIYWKIPLPENPSLLKRFKGKLEFREEL